MSGIKHGVMVCVSPEFQSEEWHTKLASSVKFEYKAVMNYTQWGKILVVVVYRSPSVPYKVFVQDVEVLLKQLSKHIVTIILGDFNDDQTDGKDTTLRQLMRQFDFKQLITEATTDHGSLIDHIYFNRDMFYEYYVETKVRDTYYSDHDTVLFTCDVR